MNGVKMLSKFTQINLLLYVFIITLMFINCSHVDKPDASPCSNEMDRPKPFQLTIPTVKPETFPSSIFFIEKKGQNEKVILEHQVDTNIYYDLSYALKIEFNSPEYPRLSYTVTRNPSDWSSDVYLTLLHGITFGYRSGADKTYFQTDLQRLLGTNFMTVDFGDDAVNQSICNSKSGFLYAFIIPHLGEGTFNNIRLDYYCTDNTPNDNMEYLGELDICPYATIQEGLAQYYDGSKLDFDTSADGYVVKTNNNMVGEGYLFLIMVTNLTWRGIEEKGFLTKSDGSEIIASFSRKEFPLEKSNIFILVCKNW
jgi:hypothetical protein